VSPEELSALGNARLRAGLAQELLDKGFDLMAARKAYLAGFHAALAHVQGHTGKFPRTHSGARSEFARLTRGRLDEKLSSFLGLAYEYKATSDDGQPGSLALAPGEVQTAIDTAYRLIAWIADDLGKFPSP
jgi:uncharacterized protein (UPF0332 family)